MADLSLTSMAAALGQLCMLQQIIPSGSVNPVLLSCFWGSKRTPCVTRALKSKLYSKGGNSALSCYAQCAGVELKT